MADGKRAKKRAAYFFFFFGFTAGGATGGALVGATDGIGAGGAAFVTPSSMLNVQWVSTFLPPDFALTITVHVLSFSRCVTWYATVVLFGSKLASTLPSPLTRISTEP